VNIARVGKSGSGLVCVVSHTLVVEVEGQEDLSVAADCSNPDLVHLQHLQVLVGAAASKHHHADSLAGTDHDSPPMKWYHALRPFAVHTKTRPVGLAAGVAEAVARLGSTTGVDRKVRQVKVQTASLATVEDHPILV